MKKYIPIGLFLILSVLIFINICFFNSKDGLNLLFVVFFMNWLVFLTYPLNLKYNIDFFNQEYFFMMPVKKKHIIIKEVTHHFFSIKNLIILFVIFFSLCSYENFSLFVFCIITILILFQNFLIYFFLVCVKNLFYNSKRKIKVLGEISVWFFLFFVLNILPETNFNHWLFQFEYVFFNRSWWFFTVLIFFSCLIIYPRSKKWVIK